MNQIAFVRVRYPSVRYFGAMAIPIG